MPLTTTETILSKAQAGGYAVGAFNIENMEMAQAVIAAAEGMNAPVILQTTPSTLRYGSLGLYYANVSVLAKNACIPVALNLDHGNSLPLAAQALRAGYTSVMIDGSVLPYEENIAVTSKVVEFCSPNHVPVEAELGKVGGKEDDLTAEGDCYTDPELAKDFVQRTGISSLAVAIGTAHGIYIKKPKLDTARLAQIRKRVDVPLVLHGASGLTENDITECIKEGICKVNFATELRIAYSDAVKKSLSDDPDVFDPKKYGIPAKESVKQLVKNRIAVCGCQGKA